ncbi:MAG: hypothetical protein EOM26_03410 [Alphaproteobacteria bacterium]|nr:hypothetical protein [Alphaproteobacteria bacterium]
MATGLEITEQRVREQDAAFHQQMMQRADQAAIAAGRQAAARPDDPGPKSPGIGGVMEEIFGGTENARIMGGVGKMAFGYGMLTELTNMLQGGLATVSGGNGLFGGVMDSMKNMFGGVDGPETVMHFDASGSAIAAPGTTPDMQPVPTAIGPQTPGAGGPGMTPGLTMV